jgi:hypothetical protein
MRPTRQREETLAQAARLVREGKRDEVHVGELVVMRASTLTALREMLRIYRYLYPWNPKRGKHGAPV